MKYKLEDTAVSRVFQCEVGAARFYYNGYFCSVQMEECFLYGKILFIDDSISFEAQDASSFLNEFKSAVDDYIATCENAKMIPCITDFNRVFTGEEEKGRIEHDSDCAR